MIIVDVFNLIYRAVGVATSKKKGTEENPYLFNDINKEFLQIFFKSFNKIYRNFKGREIVIAWEGGGDNFRHKILPDYKGNRDTSMRDMIDDSYYKSIEAGLYNYGCRILKYPNSEADDVIYSLCDFHKDKEEIIVISADTDFIQLLQKFDNVKVYSPTKDAFFENPSYDYVKYKSIKGDDADNIKGLYGYGDKKSQAVLKNYEVFWSALNEESKKMLLDNLKLIDLSKNPDKKEIYKYIELEYTKESPKFSKQAIIKFVIKYKLKDILMNIDSELGAFI